MRDLLLSACLLLAPTALADVHIPAVWEGGWTIATQLSTNGAVPWSTVEYSITGPRTESLAAVSNICWSASGQPLSPSFCQRQALTAALLFAWSSPESEHDTYSIGARDSVGKTDAVGQGYRLFPMRRDEHGTLRTEPDHHLLTSRSPSDTTLGGIKYGGSLPRTFLLQIDAGMDSTTRDESRPLFIATDGDRHEISHIQPVHRTPKRTEEADGLTYDSGHGIKVQRKSKPIASPQQVLDWLHSESNDKYTSIAEFLADESKTMANGYLAFNLQDRSPNEDGRSILIAESEGFGSAWKRIGIGALAPILPNVKVKKAFDSRIARLACTIGSKVA